MLEIDEMNTAGSLGIANVLSEYNKVTESKEIYKVLQTSEADPEILKSAMLNHAHLLISDTDNSDIEQNQNYAINLYQAAHDKFPDDF